MYSPWAGVVSLHIIEVDHVGHKKKVRVDIWEPGRI